MAHPPAAKNAVRDAYVADKLELTQAAARAEVPYDTARKWKSAAAAAGDDWDKARAAHSLTSSGAGTIAQLVLHDFLIMYQATVEEIKLAGDIGPMDKATVLAKLADSFQKTMAAVAKAAPELGRFAVATELLQDLAIYVGQHMPQHQEAVADILEPFGAWVAQKYG